jgi:uncharacterized membrane protein YedE/YeeE
MIGEAALGGALIGVAVALLWLGIGHIAGISGILARMGEGCSRGRGWRASFLVGLIAAPLLYGLAGGAVPLPTVTRDPWLLVAAGLLVGFGSRLGSGCTSGHGVCGVARLSRRSLTATATFMLAAVATVFVSRHLLGG